MFFRIFNNEKCRSLSSLIIFLIVICHIISVSGCVTTSTIKYPKEKVIQKKSSDKIEYIILKDGIKINTKNKQIIYVDTLNSLLIMNHDLVSLDTNKTLSDSLKSTKMKLVRSVGKNTIIPMKDVLEFFVEKIETDALLTTFFVTGVIAGVVLATILIKNATDGVAPPNEPPTPPQPPPPPPPPSSCPLVFLFDGENYVFDSEPISGVICENMKRTDLSKLESLKPSEGKFKLHIKNQPGEKEMLDEVKLVSVSHPENSFVTTSPEGQFFNYKNIIKPQSVTDENGKDVTVFFNEKDDVRWQTQMAFDTSFSSGSERHKLKFRFPKPKGAGRALIFVNCGTAYWGAHMIKHMLNLKGDKVEDWYGSLFSADKEIRKLIEFLSKEELFMLKVNLHEDDQYKVKTLIPAGGPLMDEDRVIRLPIENVTGDYIEFILNPPAGFWKIDQIGIIYDYELIEEKNIKVLDAIYAVDQDGRDLINMISTKDKIYYDMPDEGNYSNVEFNVPQDFDRSVNEIFIRTTGYYEIYTNKNNREQKALIEDIMNTPGKIIQYSMSQYKQNMNRFTENLNLYGKK
ncbi:MAG: hypothetical protein KDD00_05470 [Ignavibacteriae bacterium]|nr:hypothetical protein [Ignavibacteriota bacterium]